ncbi:hypothetical protein [Paenibacillus apiarius]|uniref:hypothetical protein n=1 Tax=Paenibacillus apiarius TaxID=46240 RepID=UPI001982698B|nr:hypothetical protein [Paenibacillus apiarius]MBN3523321.1 hypothetical protein [Paenibacillus apiarius]
MNKTAALLAGTVIICLVLTGCGQAVTDTYHQVSKTVKAYGKEKAIDKIRMQQFAVDGLKRYFDLSIDIGQWNMTYGFTRRLAGSGKRKARPGHVTFVGLPKHAGATGGIERFYGELNLKTGDFYELGVTRNSMKAPPARTEMKRLESEARHYVVQQLHAAAGELEMLSGERALRHGIMHVAFQNKRTNATYDIGIDPAQGRVVSFAVAKR